MALASWVCDRQPSCVAAIATFDHGTGAAASDAVDLVRAWATVRGVALHVGQAEGLPGRESDWRRARWAFLTSVARGYGVPVATAHTEDDQAETVFMRLLRQSGVRGLAGLLAAGPILRPLLGVRREAVLAFVADRHVPFLEDPSNRDLRHLRNRVRHELLPAIERGAPGFRRWLLDLGQAAATWREGVSEATDRFWAPRLQPDGSVFVRRERDRMPSEAEAALFWPEVAGRAGVALDRRGTARLAAFTTKSAGGLRMPLSGGALVVSSRAGWHLSPAAGRSAGATEKPPRTAGTTQRVLEP